MLTATRKMTVDEFQDYAATQGRCELIDGEVRPLSPTGFRHGIIVSRLDRAIGRYAEEHDLGDVVSGEPGFILDDRPGHAKVRAPDVAFVSKERVAAARTVKFCPVHPDLCAEVLSPDDRVGEVSEKVRQWLEFGVRLVWVVDPQARTVTAHEAGGEVRIYREHERLPGGHVVPGFELSLQDLFA